ncbi:MAG: hypothetical protein IJ466_07385 [Clostridia bacterium]|nr:hypothetical protein [Clostridia bacterium]
MAENIFSAIATVGSKLSDLSIQNGQLIFVRDKRTIALDIGGKRTFYNQIEELATEQDRVSLLAPVSGLYYFVVDRAVLWTYRDGWVQITTPPGEILFVGTEFPELGSANRLYINSDAGRIAIWDEATGTYVVVADRTQEMSAEEIDALFQ